MTLKLGPQQQMAADQFRSFYAQLLVLRDAILQSGDGATSGAPAAAPTIEEVRTRLGQMIGAPEYRRADIGGGTKDVDPGYVLAAVADEVLLVQCPAWAERQGWADRPIEAVLYGSRLAGERIFQAADDLLAQRRDDPRTATVILLALLTGFRGRFLARDDKGKIVLLKTKLFGIVCGRDYVADDYTLYASPDLTATTLEGQSGRPLPLLWPWIVALVVLLLLYLPASHWLWWDKVQTIDSLARQALGPGGISAAGSS